MKFDKQTLIAVAICIAVLVGWEPFCRWIGWTSDPAPAVQNEQIQQLGKADASPAPVVQTPAVPASAPAVAVKKEVPSGIKNLPGQKISGKFITLTLDGNSGGIVSAVFPEYFAAGGKVPLQVNNPSLLAGLNVKNFDAASLQVVPDASWKLLERSGSALENSYFLNRTFTADGKMFTLSEVWTLQDKYTVNYCASVINRTASPLTLPVLAVTGGGLPDWKTMSGDKVRYESQKLDYRSADGGVDDISGDAKDSKFFKLSMSPVLFTGVSNKYFCSILASPQPFLCWPSRVKYADGGKDAYLITAGAKYSGVTIAPHGKSDINLSLYIGPKVMSDLKAFQPEAQKIMHLSWGPMDYLARFLLWILIKLHGICGSYGWSIIILTLLVRLVFLPITARANNSMKKMQVIQPKIKELREKYKDNQQLLNTKMMELYREEKINPVGGCLPILLQIPVFFALYNTLEGAIALRQVPFWWAKDLAAPDTVAVLNLGFMNLPVNPLVLAMTGLMLLQQRLTPASMDPAQRKMMMIMPVAMLFFLYDLPSGLTLYWTVSSIFSILQMLWQQRMNRSGAEQAKK